MVASDRSLFIQRVGSESLVKFPAMRLEIFKLPSTAAAEHFTVIWVVRELLSVTARCSLTSKRLPAQVNWIQRCKRASVLPRRWRLQRPSAVDWTCELLITSQFA